MKLKVEIEYFDGIVGTKALPILIRAWADILEAGHVSPFIMPVAWDNEAVVAVDKSGRAIGVVSFSHQKWSKELIVTLGYVREEFRDRGIYSQLWTAVLVRAKKLGVVRIAGGAMASNKQMIVVAEAQQRHVETVQFVYTMPTAKKGQRHECARRKKP